MKKKQAREKRKRIPFWWQIAIILFCGVVVAGGVYGAVCYIQWKQYEDSLPVYTVTFAYQNGDVIDTRTAKEGRGVFPPDFEAPGVFQGWSQAINKVTADMEVHPLYYSVADENLFCFDAAYVKEGEEFTIDLTLSGEVNLSSAELSIEYDPDVMTFLRSEDEEYCTISDNGDGTLALNLKSEKAITEKIALTKLTFKALKKDVYSTQIDLVCKKGVTLSSGVEVPATVSTLNNKVYYLQEVG